MAGAVVKGRLSKWIEESGWERSIEARERILNVIALIFVFFALFAVILPLLFFRLLG